MSCCSPLVGRARFGRCRKASVQEDFNVIDEVRIESVNINNKLFCCARPIGGFPSAKTRGSPSRA